VSPVASGGQFAGAFCFLYSVAAVVDLYSQADVGARVRVGVMGGCRSDCGGAGFRCEVGVSRAAWGRRWCRTTELSGSSAVQLGGSRL